MYSKADSLLVPLTRGKQLQPAPMWSIWKAVLTPTEHPCIQANHRFTQDNKGKYIKFLQPKWSLCFSSFSSFLPFSSELSLDESNNSNNSKRLLPCSLIDVFQYLKYTGQIPHSHFMKETANKTSSFSCFMLSMFWHRVMYFRKERS